MKFILTRHGMEPNKQFTNISKYHLHLNRITKNYQLSCIDMFVNLFNLLSNHILLTKIKMRMILHTLYLIVHICVNGFNTQLLIFAIAQMCFELQLYLFKLIIRVSYPHRNILCITLIKINKITKVATLSMSSLFLLSLSHVLK